MKVQERAFVSIEYKLTLDSGEVVDESDPDHPLSFIHGQGQVIPGVERGVLGMQTGESKKLVIEAEDGYGAHDKERLQELPRENFPKDVELEAGMGFQAQTPHGSVRFQIISANDEVVMADFNHPLAGERLTFELKVAEVRLATAEEIAAAQQDDCSGHTCHGCGKH